MNFNIGDIIIGKKKASNKYLITREGWIGIITEIHNEDLISAQGYNNGGIEDHEFPLDINNFYVIGNITAIHLAKKLIFREGGTIYDFD